MCRSPYVPSVGSAFACNDCKPCRINRRRIWAHRLMIESDCHKEAAFVTLTYNDKNVPANNSLLPKKEMSAWFKNFRETFRREHGGLLRFYMCAEYGSKNDRPHYHYLIFGYPQCENPYRKKWLRKRKLGCDCVPCSFVQRMWQKGFTDVGDVTLNSSAYVAGYVVKKWTKETDHNKDKLNGRLPEYSNQSNRPGIGVKGAEFIADALFNSSTGEVFLDENGDVPFVLNRNGKSLPLGRTLRNKIRNQLGISDEKKKENYEAHRQELLDLWRNSPFYTDIPSFKKEAFKFYLTTSDDAKASRLMRFEELKQRKKIL